MKKIIFINPLLMLLMFSTSCITDRDKIKPNPDMEKYVVCPVCKGYGTIKVYSAPENKKKSEIEEDSSCYKALYGAGCLFWLGHEIANSDDMEYRERQRKKDIKNTEDYVSDDQRENVERSDVTRIIQCHRCKGTGWIDKFESDKTPVYDDKYMKSLNDANKLIDQ